ncbi:MAG: acylphosphatase [FCB group bacterium]|nr:acylphosphatase [FCB group bacterium]
MANEAVRIIVSGLVQGVGFRYFTFREAKKLGLTGSVKNLPTGQVEIIACGAKGLIDDMIKIIRVGSSYASVSGVELEEMPSPQNFTDFSIR